MTVLGIIMSAIRDQPAAAPATPAVETTEPSWPEPTPPAAPDRPVAATTPAPARPEPTWLGLWRQPPRQKNSLRKRKSSSNGRTRSST
jgi:hypothetical protein